MAEGLGMIVSTLQSIDATAKIVNYTNTCHHAEKDQTALALEAAAGFLVLMKPKKQLESPTGSAM